MTEEKREYQSGVHFKWVKELLEKSGQAKIPAPLLTIKILYNLGLAVEGGTPDEELIRETWGDEVVDWLREAEKAPEWVEFKKEFGRLFDEHAKRGR